MSQVFAATCNGTIEVDPSLTQGKRVCVNALEVVFLINYSGRPPMWATPEYPTTTPFGPVYRHSQIWCWDFEAAALVAAGVAQ